MSLLENKAISTVTRRHLAHKGIPRKKLSVEERREIQDSMWERNMEAPFYATQEERRGEKTHCKLQLFPYLTAN